MRFMMGLSFFMALAAGQASGQGTGRPDRIEWTPVRQLQRSFDRQPEKKYAIVYVHGASGPTSGPRFPVAPELIAASQGEWFFAEMDLDRPDPLKTAFGVDRTLMIVATDRHLNAVARTPDVSLPGVRALMKRAPDDIKAYETRIQADFKRALAAAAGGDRRAAIEALVKFIVEARLGYPQVPEAVLKLEPPAQEEFKMFEVAQGVGPEPALEFLRGFVALCKTTPPGLRAEIRIAQIDRDAGKIADAVARLQRIEALTEPWQNNERREAFRLLRDIQRSNPAAAAGAPAAPEPPREKVEVPSEAARKEAEKTVRDLFKEDYALRSPDDRLALARKLLAQGKTSRGDPAGAWALLSEAAEIAARAGDVALALEAVGAILDAFKADGPALMAHALESARSAAKTQEALRALAQGYLDLAASDVEAENHDGALEALSRASTAARSAKDAGLSEEVRERSKEAGDLKRERARVKPDLAKLDAAPDDPAANLAVGAYYCLVRGDWAKGLSCLAKGSDAALKAAAAADLLPPTEAPQQARAGDGWWDLAQKEKAVARRAALLSRAEHWYAQALPGLSGLARIQVEKRLEEAAAAASSVPGARGALTDLMAWVDPKQDTLPGASAWLSQGKVLVSPPNDGSIQIAAVVIPCVPPEEYDLTVVLERKSAASNTFHIGLVAEGRQFVVMLDYNDGREAGVGWIQGEYGRYVQRRFPAAKLHYDGAAFSPGKPSTIVCSVRRELLHVTLNGETILDWKKPAYAQAALDPGFPPPPHKQALFLACRDTAIYEASRVTLLPVRGAPRRISPAPKR